MLSWKKTLLQPTARISEAVSVLNDVSLRVVLVVDDQLRLLGTITDGDVRRGLMRHLGMDEPVESIMNKSPITASEVRNRDAVLALMRKRDILQIPILDAQGCVTNVEFLQDLISPNDLANPVVLMAGGFGRRLRPLTTNIPKPMLKVGNKPILESIIVQLVESGLRQLFISVFFKADVVQDYFGDGAAWNADIQYLVEDEPLGTGGALSLLPKDLTDLPILLINGDILTKVDFSRLLEFHSEQNCELTVCVREYDFQVPYGVVEISENRVLSLVEKPVQSCFVNAGIYVINQSLILGKNRSEGFDMPDLINDQILQSKAVNVFPIHEYWTDIGLKEHYEQAKMDVNKLSRD